MRLDQIVVALVTLGAITASCAQPQAATSVPRAGEVEPRAAAPKRITAAIRGDPRTLNDAINFAAGGSSSAGVREIEQLLHAGLSLVDGRGELRPQLGEAAPSLENGLWKLLPEGRMETTWKLKPDQRWHDGQPLTVDDFLFGATIAQDRLLPMSHDQAWPFVEALQAPDRNTLLVTWKSPFVDADKLFTQTTSTRNLPMPRHLLEGPYKEDKDSFVQSPYFGPEYVGAGPYRLKEWTLGSHLIAEANDRYVLGRPKIDQIEVRFILDTNTLVANLIAGALQLSLGRGLTPEQAITVRDQWREGVVDAGLQNTTGLYPNLHSPEPPLLTDVRVRRALLHALDRQQMVDTFMAGLVPIAHSIVSPDEPEYKDVEPRLARYDHDPRRAMELLDGLGLSKGADGFYRDAAGRRLSVEVRTRGHALREKLQQVVADEWARIGVVAESVVVPEQRIADRVYQATFPGFYFRFGNPYQFVEWVSKEAQLPENNYVGRNMLRYRNPDYDALVDRYVTTIPRAERVRLLGDLVHYSSDQLLILPLFHEPEPVLISNRLVNVGGARGINIQAWNVHEWDVKG